MFRHLVPASFRTEINAVVRQVLFEFVFGACGADVTRKARMFYPYVCPADANSGSMVDTAGRNDATKLACVVTAFAYEDWQFYIRENPGLSNICASVS